MTIKQLFLLALTICTFSLCSFNQEGNNPIKPFEVEFISGCNAITHFKIRVYQQEGKYFADHTSPTYFDGVKVDSLWRIQLTEEQINDCNSFLNKAKSLPRKCDRFSSVENHHIIFIGNDTIDINGDCDWDNLGFRFLDEKLFGEKHIALESRQKQFITDLHKKLIGKWYVDTQQNNLNRDDIVTFRKDKTSDFCWEFKSDSKLKGNNAGLLGIKGLESYKLQISDGWNETVFEFHWGKVDYMNHATFTFVSIDDKELKLKYLWKSL